MSGGQPINGSTTSVGCGTISRHCGHKYFKQVEMNMTLKAFFLGGCLLALTTGVFAADAEVSKNLAKVRAVGVKGEGHREAGAAAKALAKASPADLPVILAAMDGSNVLAENWLRGIAEAVAQKQNGGKIPVAELEKFLAQTKHSPR